MLLMGIDVGTSSVKVSVIDVVTQRCLAAAQYPETEAEIIALQAGWAEQNPEDWWENTQKAILACHATKQYNPADIAGIGIAYQMHGLVLTDAENRVLRNAIIWCDSRAVGIGEAAFAELGETYCLSHLLNSPGNFTASKLAWVKQNEPQIFSRISKLMLPGDFIGLRFTGALTSSASSLSEGVFWDFKNNDISDALLDHFGFSRDIFPDLQPVSSIHGLVAGAVAESLGLPAGIPVAYKAGDQPNNALTLNVLQPGEVAATAGTSGVIYAVSDTLNYDPQSRINSFAHVNHGSSQTRIGILLCINGAGIFNRWVKTLSGHGKSYEQLNEEAALVPPGSDGLTALPFGNGAERMLNNRQIGAHFHHLDFNLHSPAHMVRAAQEGIACAFRYGLDIMRENGIAPTVIRASKANLFLSEIFTETFAAVTNTMVEFYEGDGSYGAAIGAGIGTGLYENAEMAARNRQAVSTVLPSHDPAFEALYQRWKTALQQQLEQH